MCDSRGLLTDDSSVKRSNVAAAAASLTVTLLSRLSLTNAARDALFRLTSCPAAQLLPVPPVAAAAAAPGLGLWLLITTATLSESGHACWLDATVAAATGE